MAKVIGPNGLVTEVPDRLVVSLVGNGDRGYRLPEPPAKPKTRRRAASRPKKVSE